MKWHRERAHVRIRNAVEKQQSPIITGNPNNIQSNCHRDRLPKTGVVAVRLEMVDRPRLF